MKDQEQIVRSTSQMLQDGLDEVFSSQAYRRFLMFIGNNPNYSYRNALLILQQCPHATRVQGFRAWNRESRMVKKNERGLRINAHFDNKKKEEDRPPLPPSQRKKAKKRKDKNFRKISVFDISQTALVDEDGAVIEETAARGPVTLLPTPFETDLLEGEVHGYNELLTYLNAVSPLPIVFRSGLKNDGSCGYADITVKKDMSQRHTIRTIAYLIARSWRLPYSTDHEQLEVESESIAFIVCQYMGLDTSEFSFNYIAKYSLGKERTSLELFLDAIQKTALFFIDSIDGVRASHITGHQDPDYIIVVNRKTIQRMFQQGLPVYLHYKEGELFAMEKKDIEEHEGLFAVERDVWFDTQRLAA